MINIADLTDPNDSQGRTYREINNATNHKFSVGQLIELANGVRLYVAKQTRDCDGTPLYTLTAWQHWDGDCHDALYGYSEDGMKAV